MVRIVHRASLIVLGLLLSGFSASDALAEIRRSQLTALLDLGWKANLAQMSEVESHYEQLRDESLRDDRVLYGFALVKIRLRQYPDALKLVDEVLASSPNNQAVVKTRIWLTVILKNYGQALVSVEKLASQLPPEPADGGDDSAALETARFLGKVIGYLEGPAAEQVSVDSVVGLRKKLAAKWGPERAEALEEGRNSVVDRYLELNDAKEAGREKARQQAEDERDQRLVDLDKQREQDTRRNGELESQRDRLRAELNDEVRDIQKQDQPLIAQLRRLDAQATVARRELLRVQDDIARLGAFLARERDPVLRDQYLRDIGRFEIIERRYQNDLAALNRRAAGLQAQRGELARRLDQVQGNVGRQLSNVERERGEMDKRAKRREGEERKLRKTAPSGESTQTLAKAAQAAAFTTYLPFPLDAERERLIKSVEP